MDGREVTPIGFALEFPLDLELAGDAGSTEWIGDLAATPAPAPDDATAAGGELRFKLLNEVVDKECGGKACACAGPGMNGDHALLLMLLLLVVDPPMLMLLRLGRCWAEEDEVV